METSTSAFRGGAHTSAPRSTAITYAARPDVLPVFASTSLFWWSSTARVHAAGRRRRRRHTPGAPRTAGPAHFSAAITIIAIILVVVTALDQFSTGCARSWFDVAGLSRLEVLSVKSFGGAAIEMFRFR